MDTKQRDRLNGQRSTAVKRQDSMSEGSLLARGANPHAREPQDIAGRSPAMRSTLTAAIRRWTGLGILILLFLASLAYVALGGQIAETVALEASPIAEAKSSIVGVVAKPTNVGSAPISDKASIGSVGPTDYFPAAYPNRGRDGEGNVVTSEHD